MIRRERRRVIGGGRRTDAPELDDAHHRQDVDFEPARLRERSPRLAGLDPATRPPHGGVASIRPRRQGHALMRPTD